MSDDYPPAWDRDAIEAWRKVVPASGSVVPFRPTVYRAFESSPAWTVIDEAISELVENQDLVEGTLRHYLVGYLVNALTEAGLLDRPA
jgi:hypothetical protein